MYFPIYLYNYHHTAYNPIIAIPLRILDPLFPKSGAALKTRMKILDK